MTTDHAPQRSRRGGARPGAGAPKGNTNAWKHGRRSRQATLIRPVVKRLPPATRAILTTALERAMRDARDAADRATIGQSPGRRERARRKAADRALLLVMTALRDTWATDAIPRDRRDAHLVRALGPLLRGTHNQAAVNDQSNAHAAPTPTATITPVTAPTPGE